MKTKSENWVRVVGHGTFPHRASGLIQEIDHDACANIVTNYLRECQPTIRLDFDHLERLGVAGKITALQNRDDGLYGLMCLNKWGRDAVAGQSYKFLSPVLQTTRNVGSDRARPTHLLSVALTNKPVMENLSLSNSVSDSGDLLGLLVPLVGERRTALCNSTFAGSYFAADGELDPALELRAFLGLSSNATDNEVMQAIELYRQGIRPPSLREKLEKIKRKHGLLARGSFYQNRFKNGAATGEDVDNAGRWTPDVTYEDLERVRKAQAMCAQLTKHRNPRQIRRVADSFPAGCLTQFMLRNMADELETTEMEQRRKRAR